MFSWSLKTHDLGEAFDLYREAQRRGQNRQALVLSQHEQVRRFDQR